MRMVVLKCITVTLATVIAVLGMPGVVHSAAEPVEFTLVPQQNEGEIYLLRDDPNYLWLYMQPTEAAAGASELRLTMDFPAAWDVVATPYAPGERVLAVDEQQQNICPRSYDLADFLQKGLIVKGDLRFKRLCFLVTTQEAVGTTGTLAWQVEGGTRHSAQYEVLPMLRAGPRPQQITTGASFCPFYKVETKYVPTVARFLGKTGLNLYWDYDPARVPVLRQHGLQVAIEEVAAATLLQTPTDPKYAQVLASGKRYVRGTCPQAIIETNGAALRVTSWLAQTAPKFDAISLDWEHGNWWARGHDLVWGLWCFCPRCLEAFATQFGIDRAELPVVSMEEDVAGIIGTPLPQVQAFFEKYHDEYTLFRNCQYVQMLRILYHIVKQTDPHTQLIWFPYTADVQDPWTGGWQVVPFREDTETRSYPMSTSDFELKKGRVVGDTRIAGRGLTWYMFYPGVPQRGDYVDAFSPMYYSRGAGQIRSLIQRLEALKKVTDVHVAPVIWGAGTVEEMNGPYSPGELRAQVLAAAITGDGAVLYPFFAGGRTWTAVARACHEIARIEPLLVGARDATPQFHIAPRTRTDDVSVLESLIWRAREQNGSYLLAIFNLDPDRPARYRLHAYLPGEKPYEMLVVRPDRALERTRPVGTYDGIALRQGLELKTPADYGMSLLVFRPAS